MTALALEPSDALAASALTAENHRLLDHVTACERRIAELTQAVSRHVHAQERNGIKIWPGYVQCDGCRAVVAFDPLPEEARLAAVLVALGWSGHRCGRCAR